MAAVPMRLMHLIGASRRAPAASVKPGHATVPTGRPRPVSPPKAARPSAAPRFAHLNEAVLPSDNREPRATDAASAPSVATASAIVRAAAKARTPTDHPPPPKGSLAEKIIAAARKGVRL